ncbi:uncharacterized protein V1516DRAFT_482899 [Lipomyces oligophaga]|uniref:uncharacterized protein n=1 Tax=Lipomyces oligophaga TaxID=45792 RepID=UPI0034CF6DB4
MLLSTIERPDLLISSHLSRLLRDSVLASGATGFAFFYAANVIPRLINVIPKIIHSKGIDIAEISRASRHILKNASSLDGLPVFWSLLLSSSVAASRVMELLFATSNKVRDLPTLFGAGIASYLVLGFHQLRLKRANGNASVRVSGRTFDTGLFLFTSALDFLFRKGKSTTWVRSKSKYSISQSTIDSMTFIVSASVIMFSWFFYPSRLPHFYNHWITKFADMDDNLTELLRLARAKKFVYGVDSGYSYVMADSCEAMGLPRDYADPAITIPIPCVVVHQNQTSNCELHGLWRFFRAFKSALKIYLSINLVLLLRSRSKMNIRSVLRAIKNSIRSSSFLGSFVMLTWYAVCLVRTRIGPNLFPKIKPIRWDDTIAPGLGSFLSGWSIFLESPRRRGELALFVAPRALGALFPPDFGATHELLERIVFSLSFAILFSTAYRNRRGTLPRGSVTPRGVYAYAIMNLVQ